MKCPNCGTENLENAVYCQECGKLLKGNGGFWDSSLGKWIYKVDPALPTKLVLNKNNVSKTKFELDWVTVAMATLILVCLAIFLPQITGWIRATICLGVTGLYIARNSIKKQHSLLNFVSTFVIAYFFLIVIFAILKS